MKKLVYIVAAVLAILLFVPFYPITVVPEWKLQFLNKNGTPIPSIRINQSWKDYSLEYWDGGENSDMNIQSDSNGYIKLPARKIRVSVFQIISSKIRDFVMQINPHASFGSHSSVICMGEYNCVVSYEGENEKPQRVVVW